MYVFEFAYPVFFFVLLFLVLCLIIVRPIWFRGVVYRHSLTQLIIYRGWQSEHIHKKIFYCLRIVIILLLVFLCGRPRFVDLDSKIPADGIGIVIALDASGSMFSITDPGDTRCRFAIAQDEAIKFINKRMNDAIGLVLFADDVLSRCPLTYDKKILTSLIQDIHPNEVPISGTRLCHGIMVAINRLKSSTTKSKVVIVLTDGIPSPGDLDPKLAIDAALQYGIKIYTIGIGSETESPLMHPLFNVQIGTIPAVNKDLLQTIAEKTSGKAYFACNGQEIHQIYQCIDQLEKTEYEVPIYSKFFEFFIPITLVIIGLLMGEAVLKTFIWFGI